MFFPVWLVIACVLCAFLLIVWSGRSGFRKEYRDNAEGLADLLRYYRPVADGVIEGKGGELLAGFSFRGIDLESATNSEIMLIMGRLNSILKRFGTGWMLHMDGTRYHAVGYSEDDGHFPHPVLRLMDQERREQFMAEGLHYESQYAVFVTWLPPLALEAKAKSMLFDHSEERQGGVNDSGKKTLAEFQDKVGDFGVVLTGMFKEVARLKRAVDPRTGEPDIRTEANGVQFVVDHLAGYLHYCVTGIAQPIRISLNSELTLDALIGSQGFVGGITPRVGDLHIRSVVIEGFPSEAAPLVMSALNQLPVRFRWSSRFIFLDREDAIGLFEMIRKKWRQKLRPIIDDVLGRQAPVDEDAARMAADAQGAKAEASSGWVTHGHYTSTVVLMDESEATVDEEAKRVEKLIRDLGFPVRVESENAVEAYLGSLPGHGVENVRRPGANTMNVAYLFPATATWAGLTHHPCKFYPKKSPPLFMADATGASPFRGVLHYDDVGMFFLVGPPGSGKSTAVQFFAAQHFRYPMARVFLFEKGYSGYVMATATGGTHYDIGSDEDTTIFAPLTDIHIPSVRAWAEEWLCTCLELQGHKVSARDRILVREALKKLAEDESSDGVEGRTMTQLLPMIQDETLRTTLNFYTNLGANPYLDGRPSEERISFGRLNVFEMEHLMELGEKHIVPILLYLFHRIERSLNGEPTLIILDEAWLMLLHPLFRERIRAWLKTMRKANVGVGFSTQELMDLAKSEIRDVIFGTCFTRILLSNPQARSQSQQPLYRELGLNDRQIDLIGTAVPKRDYYYTSPYGNRMFRLSLGPMCLAFAGASGKAEVKQARELKKMFGDRWIVEWTRLRAGAKWAARLDSMLKEAQHEMA